MTRNLKFRVWTKGGHYKYFDFYNVDKAYIDYSEVSYIEQFTGCVDKNGKEVYEGDIIKYIQLRGLGRHKTTTIAKVEFDKGRFGFFEYKNGDDEYFNCYDLDDCEIIGNIKENPEILSNGSIGTNGSHQ